MAFLKLFDMVPGWVWAILLALALSVNVAQKLTLDHTKVKLAQAGQELSDVKLKHEKAAREGSEANRKIETLRTKAAEEINDVVDQERGQTARAVRDGDAARSLLVDATRRLGARSVAAPSDPQALTRVEARAAAFGELLEKCDAVAADLGRDAEGLATQVRGLQRGYLSLGGQP